METFETIIERGCGLDVHKETVFAHLTGKGIQKQTVMFGTTTNELLKLRELLRSAGITHVAMESTGVYWKPVYNILEEEFELMIVNARHIKAVPGRKTDVKDCEWICKLMMNGLLKSSFVPERTMRDLRDLNRFKKKLQGNIVSEKNRVEKVLEDCNIKLSSVASDTFGVSGMLILDELLSGETQVERLADLCKGRLRKKKKAMEEALVGVITPHHKFMIEASREHIKHLQTLIEKIDKQIDEKIAPYQQQIELLKTIPGVDTEGARQIISEIGVDMDHFPNEQHLASWAGVCPGNNESAGKKKVEEQPRGISI